MSPVLRMECVSKSYGRTKALDGISLELPQGQVVGLLGPNGSGKTTLLKICAGLLQQDGGTVQICGGPVGAASKAAVSYLPDRTYLSDGQRVREQLAFFRDFYQDFDAARAEAMLQQLGVDPAARFRTLSKGAREKVQLVLVMARRAKLYLLDEPIGGVDPAARDYILQTITRNRDPESTVLISTHLIADVEPVLDGFLFLNQGRIVRSGYADQVREAEGKSLDELFREVFRCF